MASVSPRSPTAAAWRELAETHALIWRLLEEEMDRACGISLVDYEVLLRLREAGDHRLRLQDLTLPGRMTKSGVSRLVDRLEAAGLIEVQSCPSDRRGAFAVLTAAGAEVEQRGASVHCDRLQQLVGESLNPPQMEQLRELLQAIHSSLPGLRRDCGA